jgi:predicted nucleotidyltransferase
MVIYGSKARGDAHPDSDLDVLLVVKNEADALRRPLRRLGYTLAVALEALPSILVYTRAEWDRRKQSGSPFRQAVERDAVPVL